MVIGFDARGAERSRSTAGRLHEFSDRGKLPAFGGMSEVADEGAGATAMAIRHTSNKRPCAISARLYGMVVRHVGTLRLFIPLSARATRRYGNFSIS